MQKTKQEINRVFYTTVFKYIVYISENKLNTFYHQYKDSWLEADLNRFTLYSFVICARIRGG